MLLILTILTGLAISAPHNQESILKQELANDLKKLNVARANDDQFAIANYKHEVIHDKMGLKALRDQQYDTSSPHNQESILKQELANDLKKLNVARANDDHSAIANYKHEVIHDKMGLAALREQQYDSNVPPNQVSILKDELAHDINKLRYAIAKGDYSAIQKYKLEVMHDKMGLKSMAALYSAISRGHIEDIRRLKGEVRSDYKQSRESRQGAGLFQNTIYNS
jgi:hypothetical protein